MSVQPRRYGGAKIAGRISKRVRRPPSAPYPQEGGHLPGIRGRQAPFGG